MEPVALQVSKEGSYSSAVARAPLLYPPETSTWPLFSSVAVGPKRGEAMEPVETQPAQVGSPVTAKLWVAVRLKALVTVAVMLGVMAAETQEGAVHTTWLVLAVFCAAASEPVLADQANVRELDWGSMA